MRIQQLLKYCIFFLPAIFGTVLILFADKGISESRDIETELFSEEESLVQKNKVRVVTVYDGDSLDVAGKNGKRIKLRLYGIDAPEKGQHFANTARAFLEDLTDNSLYTLDVYYKDKYGRYVAVLYDENGIAVQEDLIRNGFAWVYPRFCDDILLCVGWQSVQDEAKSSRQGLWQEENPITPWDFKHHKKQSLKLRDRL